MQNLGECLRWGQDWRYT